MVGFVVQFASFIISIVGYRMKFIKLDFISLVTKLVTSSFVGQSSSPSEGELSVPNSITDLDTLTHQKQLL